MLYIFESELPEKKSVAYALQNIYGIGNYYSILICKKLGFSINLKINDLTDDQISKILITIENLKIPVSENLKKLIDRNNTKLFTIQSYKGIRKSYGLPVRGQRTHTNASSAKKKYIN
jgi:small subunit ribosomal protein S13